MDKEEKSRVGDTDKQPTARCEIYRQWWDIPAMILFRTASARTFTSIPGDLNRSEIQQFIFVRSFSDFSEILLHCTVVKEDPLLLFLSMWIDFHRSEPCQFIFNWFSRSFHEILLYCSVSAKIDPVLLWLSESIFQEARLKSVVLLCACKSKNRFFDFYFFPSE